MHNDNKAELRRRINEACIDLRKEVPMPCPDGTAGCAVYHFKWVYNEPELSHLLRTLSIDCKIHLVTNNKRKSLHIVQWDDNKVGKTTLIDLTKAVLDQSDEVIEALINITG